MSLLQKVEQYVRGYLEENLSPDLLYHNVAHTERVVHKVAELAELEGCTDSDKELLQIASWFHDMGYTKQFKNNEPIGAEMAETFLKSQGVEEDRIQKVKQLIFVTDLNNTPNDELEKIMKDADCSHVGTEYFFEVSKALRKEIETFTQQKIKASDWDKENIKFLTNHQFYTKSANEKWLSQKEKNLKKLEEKMIEREKKSKDKSKDNSKKDTNKLGRGVETMFRVSLKNHMDLSAIADTKANILLSVNAIIVSVAIANLLPKLDSPSNSFLVIPTMILLFFSVASIILSVLSTRPKISNIKVTKEMIRNNKSNILFFGNFHKMSLEEFEWGIDYLIDNQETLYNTLTKDLYYLGLVLERKYRLLRITYNVFVIGIVLSAISFVVSFYLFADIS